MGENSEGVISQTQAVFDFTKAADVVAWYRIAPKRHGQQLKWLAEFRPQYRDAIREAGRLLRG
jgi:hypothetical protein